MCAVIPEEMAEMTFVIGAVVPLVQNIKYKIVLVTLFKLISYEKVARPHDLV